MRYVVWQEKRFIVVNCGRGRLLAKSAREYYGTILERNKKAVLARFA